MNCLEAICCCTDSVGSDIYLAQGEGTINLGVRFSIGLPFHPNSSMSFQQYAGQELGHQSFVLLILRPRSNCPTCAASLVIMWVH
jgi:hypothetical protein